MKKVLFGAMGLFFLSTNIMAIPKPNKDLDNFFRMAYVEVNDNDLSVAGHYFLEADEIPFFNYAAIFAANINVLYPRRPDHPENGPNNPQIYFNSRVTHILNETEQVKELQAQGIKVLLTVMGNHQNAGWACFTSNEAAVAYADTLAEVVLEYGLDGIDIDDEWSRCVSNDKSLIMFAKALKENPKFEGKILSKALWLDIDYFRAGYIDWSDGNYNNYHTLAKYLDFGWEMTYGGQSAIGRLSPYNQFPIEIHNMQKSELAIGISTNGSETLGINLANEAWENGFGGVMVYNVTDDSEAYLNGISNAIFGQNVRFKTDNEDQNQ